MLGSIKEIIDNSVIIKLDIDISNQPNLVNLHVVFENEGKRIVGEIANVNQTEMLANIVGEIESDTSFIPGATLKPSFKSQVRLIKMEELALILGDQELKPGYTNFGSSNVYTNYRINVPINDFFSNHFAVLGNSGAGKSSTVASIIQKLFRGNKTPINSTMFFFDAFGEYTQAFTSLHEENNNINYKCYTTNPETPDGELLRIPVWLLDLDDLALLLDANNAAQLPVIEKTLKLVPILTGTSESTIKRKNDIIARAVQEIMLSGGDSVKIHDQVVAVLTKFNTPTFNLQTQIVQPGYTRTLKQCLFVDKTGKMQEMELVVEFIRGYIMEDVYEIPDEELNKFYSLKDLQLALEFALIDEGALNSDQVFDYANIISVRLHSLVNGETAKYFEYPNYVTKDQYIDSLLFDKASGGKSQIVNFNINYVDDRIAKVMTKIISRMIFMRGALTRPRGSNAYHIIIEEAHRYVQKDKDVELLGYNIFERISKEGRKYGVFLAFITQRPSELSDTCISQCSNFVILRLLHPKDLNYVKEMVPNITSEIVLQLKNLKPGNAIAFGTGFKVPIALKIDRPNPEPLSSNVNLEDVWYRQPQFGNVQAIQNQDLGDPVIVDDNTSFVAMTEQPPQQ